VSEKIREIRVGDALSGKRMIVGKDYDIGDQRFIVSRIAQDTEYLKTFGVDRYNVFLQDSLGFGREILWQSFSGQPVSITYEV
jgi:hypothetical protein